MGPRWRPPIGVPHAVSRQLYRVLRGITVGMFMWVKVANGEAQLLNLENVANVMRINSPFIPPTQPFAPQSAPDGASHIETFQGEDLEVLWPSFEEIAELLPTVNKRP